MGVKPFGLGAGSGSRRSDEVRIRMAESADRHEVILDSIADGVFTVDEHWNITSFNRAAEKITGVSRAEAIGKKCFDVFQANICQSNCALRDTMRGGRHWVDRRINILNRSGEQVPVSISTSVLRDKRGQAVGGVETFRDLSAIERLRRAIDRQYTFQDIISKNHEMGRILDILPDVAVSDSTALIQGATGTGKELVARAIHNLSGRRQHPFVAVNCGALPDTLLESELFGYVRGAFTGADRDKPGRFQRAAGGTLLLDEIADISAALQVKLLRVLQEREYEPLGATKPVGADVRVIAATNQPLAEQVALGRFREDLFYRLNVVRIDLPPLSRRREDIPLLVEHFIHQFNAQRGTHVHGVSDEVMERLMRHPLPGNIRQLQNIVEYAVVLCRSDVIERHCLPPDLLDLPTTAPHPRAADAARQTLADPLARAEAETIRQTLSRHDGHRGQTAEALGINKSTLWRKMKKYGIRYPDDS